MEAYMYQYRCPGDWYGMYTGLRNIYTEEDLSDPQATDLAKKELQKQTGYKDCAINLLVKYKLSIESVKTYPEITKIPFSEKPKKKPKISLD